MVIYNICKYNLKCIFNGKKTHINFTHSTHKKASYYRTFMCGVSKINMLYKRPHYNHKIIKLKTLRLFKRYKTCNRTSIKELHRELSIHLCISAVRTSVHIYNELSAVILPTTLLSSLHSSLFDPIRYNLQPIESLIRNAHV